MDNRNFSKSKKINSHLPLNNIRNIFLFQIFSQGMRISDMQFLRWNNFRLKNDELYISYTMHKTNVDMNVYVNDFLLGLLNFLIEKNFNSIIEDINKLKLTCQRKMEQIQKYSDTINRVQTTPILEDFQTALSEMDSVDQDLDKKIGKKESLYKKAVRNAGKKGLILYYTRAIEKYYAEVSEIKKEIRKIYTEIIIQLATEKDTRNNFVFYFLYNEDFKNIKNNDFSMLSYSQYIKVTGTRSYYNRFLKNIGLQVGLSIPLTSHVARHTYAQLLLESDEAKLIDISQSLGHLHISTTQNYISKFENAKVERLNDILSKKFIY